MNSIWLIWSLQMLRYCLSSSIESQPAPIHLSNHDWFVGHLEKESNYLMVSCSFQVNAYVLVKCCYFHVWICPETAGPVPVAFVFAVYTWDYMRSVSSLSIQSSSLLYNQLILPLCALYRTIIPICQAFISTSIGFYPNFWHDSVIFVVQYRYFHKCNVKCVHVALLTMLFPFIDFLLLHF